MRRLRRRDFLKAAGATSAGLATIGLPRLAGAEPWATPHSQAARDALLPSGVRAERVLEVFMYGGVPPFETFYVVPDHGRPTDPEFPRQQWHLWDDLKPDIFGNCGIGLPEDQWLAPFGLDHDGFQVHLGPALEPLRARPDLVARMRILVQAHDLEPHEAAIPMALAGRRLGNPRLAGLGASVQRYFQDRDSTGRRSPFSYVLYPANEISTDNLRAASAVGLHPGSARPLDLRIQQDSPVPGMLARPTLGARRDAYDALVSYYAGRARERYPVRSRALADYEFMTDALRRSGELAQLFPPDVLATIANDWCNVGDVPDLTAMGLKLGAHLLTHPTAPARYVTVVDGGLLAASGGGAFDVHDQHLRDSTMNMLSTMTDLVDVVREPGDDDPSKIDLDDTLIVLNTEFGRTPYMQPETDLGTNHWPYGYVTVLIGGPITEDQAGVVGAIGPDGRATTSLTPSETRAGVLAGMGIWPFADESFAIGDFPDQSQETSTLRWLNEIVLGRPS